MLGLGLEQSRVSQVEGGGEGSILWNYEELFEEAEEFVAADPGWEQGGRVGTM